MSNTEEESGQTLKESPLQLSKPQDSNANSITDNACNKSEHDENDTNDNLSSVSVSTSPQLTKQPKELQKAERALSRLLDHSHELTTKLRQRLKLKNKSNKSNKHRNNSVITEAVENALLGNDQENETDIISHFETNQQPSSITGGRMYGYQIEALNWLIQLFELNRNECFINGILADDMGLGKTLETISLLSYLKQYRNMNGPHIVIVPLSTAQNWINEFTKWNPQLNVFLFHGNQLERQQLILRKLKEANQFDVLVTSYEMAMIEASVLRKIPWEYLIIDEAHRIKNESSKLSRIVRLLGSKYRLLLTGTPLQNNMRELWSLLNFLSPQIFNNCDLFVTSFSNDSLQNNASIVHKLHGIIRPFMLRRLKSDVAKDIPPKTEICLYCGMSALQKTWYKNVLSRNLDEINRKSKSKTRLLNILMQLRKVCNHPYLFEGAEAGPPFVEGTHLYENCGKLALLHKLLKKLFLQHSRVLIFSQMTRMLDILEDYMLWMHYQYCRIDGTTKQQDRNQLMDDFNAPNSPKQVFLLSTRAGGLGINLQTADVVILYDSDWNPQMDIQAQDRAHRIGQKKPVQVYRLITEHSVEEKILDRCLRKLYLNAVVVRKGAMLQSKDSLNVTREMVRFGAEYILRSTASSISDEDIDSLIQIGKKRTEQSKSNIHRAFDHNVMDFKMDLNEEHNYQHYEGKDYSQITKQPQPLVIDHGPRQRNLNVNYKEDVLDNPPVIKQMKPRRVFKVALHSKYKYDFQLVTDLDRLHQIEKKQFDADEERRVQLWNAKQQFKRECVRRRERIRRNKLIEAQKRIKLRRDMLKNGGEDTATTGSCSLQLSVDDEALEWERKKREIEESVVGLSDKEEKEMKRLTKHGVIGWNWKDFNQFVGGLVECGRDGVEEIAGRMENKTLEEVKQYAALFWKRGKKLIKNWKKVTQRIEDASNKREEKKRLMKALRKNGWRGLRECKMDIYKGNAYTMALDRFILCKVGEYGLHSPRSWKRIRKDILKCKLFWNQWKIRAKTETEIKNRAIKLLKLLDGKSNESNDANALSNTRRKRVTKKYVEQLVQALKPNTAIEIWDETKEEWKTCQVIKYCDKDRFCLRNVIEDTQFEQHFKVLEFRITSKKDNKKKRKRSNTMSASNSAAKRRRLK